MNTDAVSFAERLDRLLSDTGTSRTELLDYIGVSKSALSRYLSGKYIPKLSVLKKISDFFNVDPLWLSGCETSGDTLRFSSMGNVAAGYGHEAVETLEEDFFSIPADIIKGYSKEDFMLLTVSGDSMYPKFEDGDKILVLYQPTCENGRVAVVKYGDDNATLKKVHFQGNSIVLEPINSEYPEVTIRGQQLSNFSIVGVPKYLVRRL